jgi:membrane fusion protein (multidrug efflux system)
MTTKKSWFRKLRRYIPFVIIIFGIFFYFNSKNKVTVLVKKVLIESRVVKKTVSASGSVKSKNQADMSFSLSAQLTNIYVKEGQKVYAGQILASVDNKGLAQTAQSYRDALDIAKREKELFIENEDSNKDLYHGEEGYNIKLKEYQESVSQAEANYQLQLINFSKSSMYAPFAGTVIEITKKVGEMATATETIVKLADIDSLYFEITADQSDFGSIKIGQSVEINLDSYPGLVIVGKVNELPSQANPTDSNFVVKIDIIKPVDKEFKIGMTGDAYMTTESSVTEVPSLIYSEVQTDEAGKNFVWVVDNKKLFKQYIDIGIEGDIYTEIKTKVDKQIVIPATENEKIQEGFTPKIIN